MQLSITTTNQPASDLGYLLFKNPSRLHTFELPFGKAYVFYPEANEETCTMTMLLDVDPVELVRSRKNTNAELFAYVNDRPYVASSFLSVAIARVFGTAMTGRSEERPELANQAISLRAVLTMLPSREGEDLLRRLFEPLGYKVTTKGHLLDEKFPEWGQSDYFTVALEANLRLRELLSHLYVLIPVLDEEKHYWVGEDEIDKLLRHGAGWLADHPERDFITSRYLKRFRSLTSEALKRLLVEDKPDLEEEGGKEGFEEAAAEESINLNQQRLKEVSNTLKELGATRVIDLGCGEGNLLKVLLAEQSFKQISGMDVSYRSLERAKRKLNLDQLPSMQKERITLFQGSLTYRDKRISGYDAATVIEVIEHLDRNRLDALERVVFEFAKPRIVFVTTPNREYNPKFPSLAEGQLRHLDHRFEWTREEFQAWALEVAKRFGYTVQFKPIGPEDPVVGAPTQMGVFTL